MKKLSLLLALVIIISSTVLAPYGMALEPTTEEQAEIELINEPATEATTAPSDTPVLLDIGFKNATIDTPFDPDVHDYTITLTDSSITPTLESYAIGGNANIFVTYESDELNHDYKTGLTATIKYETGSKIYTFKYSNPPKYQITSNCNLSDVYVFCGEVYPKLNDNDTSYKLYIPCDMELIEISPSPQDINASCIYNSEIKLLPEQTLPITIKCVASDGSEKTYTFDVKRSSKTTEQVKYEMSQIGYVSLVEGNRFYEKPEFQIAAGGAVLGIALLVLLLTITKRIAISPYDRDEKPFYSSIE